MYDCNFGALSRRTAIRWPSSARNGGSSQGNAPGLSGDSAFLSVTGCVLNRLPLAPRRSGRPPRHWTFSGTGSDLKADAARGAEELLIGQCDGSLGKRGYPDCLLVH